MQFQSKNSFPKNTESRLEAVHPKLVSAKKIYHIFFHSLIVYPDLAYSKKDKLQDIYKNYMITNTEFKKILDQLYKNNFVLISSDSIIAHEQSGKIKLKDVVVPEGKKPLIISVDDLSYYKSMKGRGFANKLILDKDGNIATQVITPSGDSIITRDGDVVPILDDFIKAHPDFSMNGAKGLIALTGYEGILGYRTNIFSATDEIDNAKIVVEKLKSTGWKFASHSYSHDISFQKDTISLDDLKTDTEKWQKEVEPLVGKTDIFVGPFGQIFKEKDPRRQYLISQGFDVFYGVGMDLFFHFYSDHLAMDRADIDGYRLLKTPKLLYSFFDPELVKDR